MGTREKILQRVRTNIGEKFDMPNVYIDAIVFDDVVNVFMDTCRRVSGAEIVVVGSGEEHKLPSLDARGESSTARGDIGVAENGCIWIPQSEDDRSFLFTSEHLDIIINAADIVSNMHEAYKRIEKSDIYFRDYKYGVFISGPSKTADIEGALVYGAQAARSVTVYIVM